MVPVTTFLPTKTSKEEIHDFCQFHGINRSELARALKVTRQTIWRWEQEDLLPISVKQQFLKYEQAKSVSHLEKALRELPIPYRESVSKALCELIEALPPLICTRYTPEDINRLLVSSFAPLVDLVEQNNPTHN